MIIAKEEEQITRLDVYCVSKIALGCAALSKCGFPTCRWGDVSLLKIRIDMAVMMGYSGTQIMKQLREQITAVLGNSNVVIGWYIIAGNGQGSECTILPDRARDPSVTPIESFSA